MNQGFFVQALIYLGSAVIMVPIAKRLGLGSVLGYLIAGVIIGPFVLGWMGSGGGDIMEFAEMGVVMMLFLIGLDVEPKTLWRWRRAMLGMGGLQIILTTAAVGYLGNTFLDLSINQSIALGLIFAMSSTAIVIQTMTENNWMQTTAGHNAFSVLLFQDIAVIFILALLPLLGPEHSINEASTKTEFLLQFPSWARTLVVLGAVGVLVVGGRYLTRPLFQMVASTNLRELFSATALILVLGITVLMTLVGLSPALGAFLGGVVLANSEYKHELEGEMQPFKGLLLGLFFIAVGISINFHLIGKQPIMVFVTVFFVMIVKLLILIFLGWLFKMKKKQYLLFAFSLAQVGEFAFVLLTFSATQKIFTKEFSDFLMVIVAVSMALSPAFMIFLDKVWMPYVFSRFTQDDSSGGLDSAPEGILPKDHGRVIIAGYGRFGSLIGRFLRVNGVDATILDANSGRVETLRKFGANVFYGDALRLDLLKIAGAEQAQLIVVALNDQSKNLRLVKIIKKHFPEAHIVARAHDQRDAYDLMDAGVLHVYRETLDTSLRAGRDALSILGVNEKAAQRAANLFLLHDEKTLKTLAAARFDEKEYYRLVRSGLDDLQILIQNDLEEQSLLHTTEEPPIEEKKNEESSEK